MCRDMYYNTVSTNVTYCISSNELHSIEYIKALSIDSVLSWISAVFIRKDTITATAIKQEISTL